MLCIVAAAVPATADGSIFACNSTGFVTQSFYDNESVYVTGNVTGADQNVFIYIVNYRTSWPNGTLLTNISLSYTIIQANSTGGIEPTLLWPTPNIGSYDIVADVDRNGVYNSTLDFVDNVSVAGFTVLEAPKPTLTVVLGKHHPGSHDCDLETEWEHNTMMQINMTANDVEDINIDSMAITAFGSGDDKEDIHVAYLIYDINGDAVYDSGDALLSYGNYMRDDGAIFFDLEDGFVISRDQIKAFIIVYTMTDGGSLDDTYRFDLISISASGRSTGRSVEIDGLPLGSAIKTISNEAPTTTTTSPGETTTTILGNQCQTDADCGGTSCLAKTRVTNRCTYDSSSGFNKCVESAVDVVCCYDGDCVEGYYCINYDCVKESGGGFFDWFGSGGGSEDGEGGGGGSKLTWTLIYIVIVVVIVLGVFLFVKNRKGRRAAPKGKEKEEEWTVLKKKWRENK